ncbi:MAG: NERD domain-containing protein [Propionibacteriaceae bacterium]|nr:NERD domain-containing protein [Propionibacteriaceae bacterium]
MADKGRYGEYLTGLEVESLTGYHRVLYNLYVPKADGTTSEIDLVFIHQSGVYVIESKNYSGAVYGSRDDRQWTVVLAGGRRKERLYNPLRQNQGHITALSAFLPWLDPSIIHSIVVFSVRCSLAKVPANTPTAMTVKRDGLAKALRATSGNAVLTVDQVEYLFSVLQPLTQVSSDVKEAHRIQVAVTRSQMPIPPSPPPFRSPEMVDDGDQIKPYTAVSAG